MTEPCYIEAESVSQAWARAFVKVTDDRIEELTPLVVSISGLTNNLVPEEPGLRAALDKTLARLGNDLTCEMVAGTIFPTSLWNRARPRVELFERYLRVLPRIRSDRRNRQGVYFQRMVSYGTGGFNQLEHVIGAYNEGVHRRSALQVAIFDPGEDHTRQRQRGFPCIQQVGFAKIGEAGLVVTAYLPMQYIFERAYGNYLGLARLGQFVAHEVGLELKMVQCFVGVASRGDATKAQLADLRLEAARFAG